MTSRKPPPRRDLAQEALGALAVPVRYALISHLLSAGPRTASECAVVVGESASNCSWHLRALAQVGLVEPAEREGDGRSRPWRAAVPGFAFADDSPAGDVAAAALTSISARHADELYQRYLDRRGELPAPWRAATDNNYALRVTPAEAEQLMTAIDDVLRPYVRPIRPDAPQGSEIVHVTLRGFLDPDVARESGQGS
ncbi:helix-turn-helix domain-containing protein [Nocardioides sp. InS609-2]|uniref:ArsR/SmtB family transcription factor n=1 Tax=Nocardioides sp. InS609-2 TaxID=2760705 RepID=UPI0020C0CD01|nr:helix-turn-helix domain-containing protein [Nocardioides sp. InS609-2]